MKTLRILGILATVFSVGASLAADRYVDGGGACGGNTPCYTTIGAALAAVTSDGETIDVGPGTYTENLTINQPVNLVGAGAGVTTLQSGNGAAEQLIMLGANSPITFSQGMVIEGFTFKGPLDGDEDLLKFRARVADPLDPIVVRDNVFDCDDADDQVKGIETVSGGDITNAVIENNSFINLCRYSVYLNSAINWKVQGNTFDNFRYGGVVMNTSDVDQLHDIEILENTFQNGSTDGLAFLPNQYVAAIGLSSTMYNVQVSGNTIQDNPGSHSITVGDRGNTVLTGINIECNDIINNAGGAYNELPASVIPAENNYWGAASGPTHAGNPGGTGDTVTDGFDYDPFLATNFGPDCPTPPAIPATSPQNLMILGIALIAMLGYALTRRVTSAR